MEAHRKDPVGTTGTHRVEALSDGVFAIIMTVLVFDLRLPDVPPAELPGALLQLWPNFLGYAISFVVLGIYWIGHRNQFNFIRHADRNLHWLNILFFGVSALVPFSTGLISRYPDQWLAVAIYGLNLILIGLALYGHWRYAVSHDVLVDGPLPREVIRVGGQRTLLGPALYALAIPLGLIDPRLSLLLYVLVPLLYIFPGIQGLWHRLAHR